MNETSIYIIFIQIIVLITWFDTDAFIEYFRYFTPLSRFFKIKGFDDAYEHDFELTYHSYLRLYYNCFFVRLITCPLCLNTWLTLISCVACKNLFLYPIIWIGSTFGYYLFVRLKN